MNQQSKNSSIASQHQSDILQIDQIDPYSKQSSNPDHKLSDQKKNPERKLIQIQIDDYPFIDKNAYQIMQQNQFDQHPKIESQNQDLLELFINESYEFCGQNQNLPSWLIIKQIDRNADEQNINIDSETNSKHNDTVLFNSSESKQSRIDENNNYSVCTQFNLTLQFIKNKKLLAQKQKAQNQRQSIVDINLTKIDQSERIDDKTSKQKQRNMLIQQLQHKLEQKCKLLQKIMIVIEEDQKQLDILKQQITISEQERQQGVVYLHSLQKQLLQSTQKLHHKNIQLKQLQLQITKIKNNNNLKTTQQNKQIQQLKQMNAKLMRDYRIVQTQSIDHQYKLSRNKQIIDVLNQQIQAYNALFINNQQKQLQYQHNTHYLQNKIVQLETLLQQCREQKTQQSQQTNMDSVYRQLECMQNRYKQLEWQIQNQKQQKSMYIKSYQNLCRDYSQLQQSLKKSKQSHNNTIQYINGQFQKQRNQILKQNTKLSIQFDKITKQNIAYHDNYNNKIQKISQKFRNICLQMNRLKSDYKSLNNYISGIMAIQFDKIANNMMDTLIQKVSQMQLKQNLRQEQIRSTLHQLQVMRVFQKQLMMELSKQKHQNYLIQQKLNQQILINNSIKQQTNNRNNQWMNEMQNKCIKLVQTTKQQQNKIIQLQIQNCQVTKLRYNQQQLQNIVQKQRQNRDNLQLLSQQQQRTITKLQNQYQNINQQLHKLQQYVQQLQKYKNQIQHKQQSSDQIYKVQNQYNDIMQNQQQKYLQIKYKLEYQQQKHHVTQVQLDQVKRRLIISQTELNQLINKHKDCQSKIQQLYYQIQQHEDTIIQLQQQLQHTKQQYNTVNHQIQQQQNIIQNLNLVNQQTTKKLGQQIQKNYQFVTQLQKYKENTTNLQLQCDRYTQQSLPSQDQCLWSLQKQQLQKEIKRLRETIQQLQLQKQNCLQTIAQCQKIIHQQQQLIYQNQELDKLKKTEFNQSSIYVQSKLTHNKKISNDGCFTDDQYKIIETINKQLTDLISINRLLNLKICLLEQSNNQYSQKLIKSSVGKPNKHKFEEIAQFFTQLFKILQNLFTHFQNNFSKQKCNFNSLFCELMGQNQYVLSQGNYHKFFEEVIFRLLKQFTQNIINYQQNQNNQYNQNNQQYRISSPFDM